MSEKIVLGIESSCDDTGVAILKGNKVLGNTLASSMEEHAAFGGIIPEIASRAHLEAITPCLQNTLSQADIDLKDIDAIAVTAGPGLAGSLAVGVSAAKGLALALNKPIYGVNHIIAHFAVNQVQFGYFDEEPFVALVVSGGHTSLFYVKNIVTDYEEVGGTLDDAAGEAFDKVARVLGLGYPGGVYIDKLSQKGNNDAIHFPRALMTKAKNNYKGNEYNFSFSGVKTAAARYIEQEKIEGREPNKEDIAASFSTAVNDVLTQKTVKLAKDRGAKKIVVAGGFSANSQLRSMMSELCEKNGITLQIPEIKYCTDNAVMVAMFGQNLLKEHAEPCDLDFPIVSSLELDKNVVR